MLRAMDTSKQTAQDVGANSPFEETREIDMEPPALEIDSGHKTDEKCGNEASSDQDSGLKGQPEAPVEVSEAIR